MTNLLMKHTIDEPEKLRGDYYDSMSHKFNWTAEFIKSYAERHRFGLQGGDCMSQKTGERWDFEVKYPEKFVEYVPEDKCPDNSDKSSSSSVFRVISPLWALLIAFVLYSTY